MWTPALPAVATTDEGQSRDPLLDQAAALARELLGPHGTKLDHVRTASRVAMGLGALFGPDEHRLLIAAANIHDIGYSPAAASTGFHPVDGARHLRRLGFDERVVCLVAHHSHAQLLAPHDEIERLVAAFAAPDPLLADALVYADMHSSPSGQLTNAASRITDIERRHPHPRVGQRSVALRASVRRIEDALRRADRR